MKNSKSARRESAALVTARAAFSRGEFDFCRRYLELSVPGTKREAVESSLLRARAARAAGDNEDWLLASTEALRDAEGSTRATAVALRAGAAKALNKGRDARADFDLARREVARLPVASGGDTRYLLAMDAFENGELDRAEQLLKENVSAGVVDVQSRSLLGWIEFRRDHLAEAIVHFSAALRKLASAEDRDLEAEVSALHGLLAAGVESIDLRALERARKAYAAIDWPRSVRATHTSILTYLTYASLLENDLDRAFVHVRKANCVAPDIASLIVTEIEGAKVTRLLGDRNAERVQLANAWAHIKAEKAEPNDLFRYAIAAFIIEASRTMPAEARKAMTIYRNVAAKSPASARADHRTVAIEAEAVARLSEALGDDYAAERMYQKAFDIWSAIGYDMRASFNALDLRRITGDDDYSQTVRRALSRAPQAWFASDLEDQDGPLGRLSPAELVVLAHLLRGETAKAIGETLDRSPFTISNHTRKIFQAFEVNSRSKVIAICAELGVTPEDVERLAR